MVLFLVILPALALACKEYQKVSTDNVLELFVVGDFVPHVPTIADVKAQLGSIQEAYDGQDRIYTYRVAPSGWMKFRSGEALQDRYVGVEEVIYSRFPPAPESSTQMVGRNLSGDRFAGIGLGEPVSKLEAQGVAFRKSEVELFGRKMTVYERTPQAGQDDLFYRYFVVGGQVEALSIGVTE